MDNTVEGIWAVAVLTESRSFIGRIESKNTAGEHLFNDEIAYDIAKRSVIRFEHGFDFFAPLQQMPPRSAQEMNQPPRIGRIPMVTPFEFTSSPCPVYVRGWTSIYFIDDMEPHDRSLYMELISGAVKQQVERRAQRSGISLASSGGLHIPR
jgi:hypothetical protein